MKKIFIALLLSLSVIGCDAVYRYVFLPPERIEKTLVPNNETILALNDTSYYITRDGQAVGYDAKNWKVEIRYMSDYQLNTFEFPSESDDFELSGNPYTYGNWTDPQFGFTPKRFTVFKVTIYNYTGSKINYDPESTVLQTDRGDYFVAYAREQKNARNQSIEEYYKIRKGAGGVDDEVYETRMGIARRTMLYYGKPIYKGDSREGLIVFDPIVNSVEELKVTIKNFVLEYDENNEPSDFTDLVLYFKQVPLVKEAIITKTQVAAQSDTTKEAGISGNIKIALLKYVIESTRGTYTDPWNPLPRAVPSIIEYAEQNSKIDAVYVQLAPDEKEFSKVKLAFILGGPAAPQFSTNFINSVADFLQNGGFLYIDNAYITADWPYARIMDDFIKKIQQQLTVKSEVKRINLDHPLFKAWQQFDILPKGFDDLNANIEPSDYLTGLFIEGKLAAILSTKGYPAVWVQERSSNIDNEIQLKLGVNIIAYALKN